MPRIFATLDPDTIPPTGGVNFNREVALNLKNFGTDIGGNWNEPDYNYASTGQVLANMILLGDGSLSGVSCEVTSATAGDVSGNTTAFTANIPAPAYDRGARQSQNQTFTMSFAGFPNDTPIEVIAGIYVTESVFATENATLTVTNGAGTTNTVINGTNPTEYIISGNVATATGVVVVSVTADNVVNNGCGIVAIRIKYVV